MFVRVLLIVAALMQGPPPAMPEWARERGYSGSGSQIVSPTVVATWMKRVERDVETLELLVLWRGKPGWFLEGNGHRSTGGGTADVTSATIEYAGRPLTVVFDRKLRVATVQERPIDLKPDLNVVLVDGVDGPSGGFRMSTAHVDPALPAQQPQLPEVLRRSNELRGFLQCDLVVPQPSAQRTIALLCAQVHGGIR